MNIRHKIASALMQAGYRIAAPRRQGGTWDNAGALGYPQNVGGIAPDANMNELLKAYQGWVYAATSAIARDTAKQDLRLFYYQGDEKVEVDNHPLLDLFKYINPIHTSIELWMLTVDWLELAGNAYWYLPLNGFGVPGEIWPIPPDRMWVVPDSREFIKGYIYRYRGTELAFRREEIIHLRYPNPWNLYYGFGTLQAAVYEYDMDLYMKQYSTNLFKNDGRPTGVIMTDQSLMEDQIRKIQEQWRRLYAGVDAKSKIAVLQAGTRYERIQVPPAELDYVAARGYNRDDILAIFGVPASKLGLVKDVNRANAEANNYTYAANCIQPRLEIIAANLNKYLVSRYDSRLFVEFDNPVPSDKEFELKRRESNLQNYVITINEARSEQGLEPVAWGDEPLVPFNLAPISMLVNEMGAASYEEAENQNFISETPVLPAHKSDMDTTALRDLQWHSFVRLHSPLQEKFRSGVRSLFKRQRAEVMANLKKRLNAGSLSGPSINSRNKFGNTRGPARKNADPVLIDQILFSASEWEERFAKEMTPAAREIYKAGVAKGLADIAAKDFEFDFTNPRVTAWIAKKVYKFSFETNQTTLNALRTALIKGLDANETLEQIAERIGKIFDDMDTWRALRIARTETTTVINAGITDSYSESGLVEGKGWLTARDESVRDSHQIDGQEVPVDGLFVTPAGNQLRYPGDPDAPAGEIIHCRCTVYPVLKR